MSVLEYRLESAGYWVISFDYPSTSEPIETLVRRLAQEVAACCADSPETVHFVTHSMGGVLVRSYLAEYSPQHRGRVVMLSPPSQGSELIDVFADSPLLRLVVGPAGASLGTDSLGIASRLGPADFSLGIITGDRSFNALTSWLIPGNDDGKVSVERARIEGAAGFLVVPASHTFIMNRDDVGNETLHFLEYGRFSNTTP
jgi:pimeloyl-ACP methyl ester carboxylesterase